jgi:hypothetical protein
MEAEHADIDPLIEEIDTAFDTRDVRAAQSGARHLRAGLTDHMQHEEREALPLVERYLGEAGWAEFGGQVRRANGGLRGGATYLPWVLDGADPAVRSHFLALLPAPARLLYGKLWEPAYRRRSPWTAMGGAS